MNRILYRLWLSLLRTRARRQALIGLWGLSLCLGLWGASTLQMTVSIDDQVEPALTSVQDLAREREEFGIQNTLLAYLQRTDGGRLTSEDYQLIDRLTERVPHSRSLFSRRVARLENGALRYPRVSSEASASSDSPWRTLYGSPRETGATLEIEIPARTTSGPWGTFDAETTTEARARAEELLKSALNLRVSWLGTAEKDHATRIGVEANSNVNLLMIAFLIVSMVLLFRTLRAGLLYLATLAGTLLQIYGGMAILGLPIDLLSLSIFLILAVSTVEDFVFISYRRATRKISLRSVYLGMITPGFLTSLTTVIGFASLGISELHSVRVFGFTAAIGALLEWFWVFFLIPALQLEWPSLQRWTRRPSGALTHSARFAPPRWLARGALLVFPLAIYASTHFRVTQNPTAIFPSSHPLSQAQSAFVSEHGWVATASLLESPEIKPSTRDRVRRLIERSRLVVRTLSPESFESDLLSEITDPKLRDVVLRESRASGALGSFRAPSGRTRTLLLLNSADTSEIEFLRHSIARACYERECSLSGEYVAFAEHSSVLLQTLFESLALSLLLVGGVLIALARSTGVPAWSLLVSSFWGPLALGVVLWIFKVEINGVTCVIAATLVGLTGDNAIQYAWAARNRGLGRGMDALGGGSIQAGLTMAGASLVFLASAFEPPRVLGLLLALGFALSLIGDLWILRGLRLGESAEIR